MNQDINSPDTGDSGATNSPAVVGQKFAFATASLLLGIACFINLLGMEKAILAIAFGVLALRAPRLPLRRHWAIAGVVLGCLEIVLIAAALLLFHDQLAAIIEHLKRFG